MQHANQVSWRRLKPKQVFLRPSQAVARDLDDLDLWNTCLPASLSLCRLFWVASTNLSSAQVYGDPGRLQHSSWAAERGDPNDLGPYYDGHTDDDGSSSSSSSSNSSGGGGGSNGRRAGDNRSGSSGNSSSSSRSARLDYWLGLCDFYVYKDVVLFDSWEHLIALLASTDLKKVCCRRTFLGA